jgi:aryl-alcohol dehydrogenase-like predicted oxidoreductase
MVNVLPTRPLGRTGLEVSVIGLGALEIGRDWAADVDPDPHHLAESDAINFVHEVLDLGINFIDTAPAYWYSEEFLGKALRGQRDKVILATKVGEHCDPSGSVYDYSFDATLRFIDRSLERLGTDYIDLVQIHSAPLDVLERGETYSALEKAKKDGKVLHIGMTGGVQECRRAIELGVYDTVQVPYNLLNIAAERDVLPLAANRQVGVIVMRGLAGGKLTSKYRNLQDELLRRKISSFERFVGPGKATDLAHLAVGYLLASPEVSTVIVGSRKAEHVRNNIKAALDPLPASLVNELRAHAASLDSHVW